MRAQHRRLRTSEMRTRSGVHRRRQIVQMRMPQRLRGPIVRDRLERVRVAAVSLRRHLLAELGPV